MVVSTIQDLLGQDVGDVQVHVVDNSPYPLELTSVRHGMGVKEWRSGENLGVGRSWNKALQRIFSIGSDYALVVNQDVRLRLDTYRLLLEPLGGFVTGVGVHQTEDVAWNVRLKTGIFPKLKGGPDFSCFLIRKDFYEKVGPFDECFFPGYREDNSYHWRAKCAGLGDQIFSVNVPYLHIDGGSSAIKNNPELKKVNDENWAKNGLLYEKMWGGPPGREVFTTPFGSGESPYSALPEYLL